MAQSRSRRAADLPVRWEELTASDFPRAVEQAQFAAGRVIWAFSQFVTSGSLAVGVILFAIIAVIQFVVVTRGAARISEVLAVPGRAS